MLFPMYSLFCLSCLSMAFNGVSRGKEWNANVAFVPNLGFVTVDVRILRSIVRMTDHSIILIAICFFHGVRSQIKLRYRRFHCRISNCRVCRYCSFRSLVVEQSFPQQTRKKETVDSHRLGSGM